MARNLIIEEDSSNNGLALSERFMGCVEEFRDALSSVEGFVKEYNYVVKKLIETMKNCGLSLKKVDREDEYFSFEDLISGKACEFRFYFTTGVNIDEMDDEQYQRFYAKLNYMYGHVKMRFKNVVKFGDMYMYTTEDGIDVYYSFELDEY
jgi:translation initiation factor 2 alpha subunit (eIF-2alpha)